MSNLEFWESVSKTDPSATKTDKRDGREQTSINGYWMIQKATEKFGMVGIGWGWDVLEERWDDGALITIKVSDTENRLEQSKTHTIKLKLWFIQDGKRGEIIQYGHTQAIYKSKWGVSDDGEAPKKSLMDAIKKSLSMLGFCSDVFMGMFEDASYLNQLKIESEIERAEDKEAEINDKRKDAADFVTKNLESIKAAKSEIEVNGFVKVAVRYLEARKKIGEISDICERGLKAIAIEAQTRKEALKNEAA